MRALHKEFLLFLIKMSLSFLALCISVGVVHHFLHEWAAWPASVIFFIAYVKYVGFWPWRLGPIANRLNSAAIEDAVEKQKLLAPKQPWQ